MLLSGMQPFELPSSPFLISPQAGIGTYYQAGIISPLFSGAAKLMDKGIAWYVCSKATHAPITAAIKVSRCACPRGLHLLDEQLPLRR